MKNYRKFGFDSEKPLCIEAYEKTSEAGDLATSDLLIDYIKRTEKSHWMLDSFIK